jgi:hypothetical protein
MFNDSNLSMLMWMMVVVVVVVVLTVSGPGRYPRLVVDGTRGDGERWWW